MTCVVKCGSFVPTFMNKKRLAEMVSVCVEAHWNNTLLVQGGTLRPFLI